MNKILLEEQLSNVKLSYDRQLSQSGNSGYDPKLTFDLKKDIEWFEQEIRITKQPMMSKSASFMQSGSVGSGDIR